MSRWQAAIPVLLVYCQWVVLLLFFQWVGLAFKVPLHGQRILFPLFLLLFMFFGFWQTGYFILQASRRLDGYAGVRAGLLLFSVGLGLLLVLAGHMLPFGRAGLSILNTANLFVFANLLGTWMVKPLRRPAELIILCLVLFLSDLFSLLKGPTRRIIRDLTAYYETGMSGPPPAGDFLLVKTVVPGAYELQPVFGVSDWIVLVFLSAAACKLGVNDNLAGRSLRKMEARGRISVYFPVAGAGLLIAVAAAMVFNVFVPALPIVASVFAAYILVLYPSSRKLQKKDWRLIVVVFAVMLSLLGVGYVI